MYHLLVTVTLNLTSDLTFRLIVSRAYLFHNPFWVTMNYGLVSRIGIESDAYLLYSLR